MWCCLVVLVLGLVIRGNMYVLDNFLVGWYLQYVQFGNEQIYFVQYQYVYWFVVELYVQGEVECGSCDQLGNDDEEIEQVYVDVYFGGWYVVGQ